jgi:hypothetical protein
LGNVGGPRNQKPVIPWVRLDIGFLYSLFALPEGGDVSQVQTEGSWEGEVTTYHLLGPPSVGGRVENCERGGEIDILETDYSSPLQKCALGHRASHKEARIPSQVS